jgi:hypothetical protein
MLEPAAHLDCGCHRAALLEELAAQLIDPLDVAPANPVFEHSVLELRHFALHRLDDRQVVVDHEIEDGVENAYLVEPSSRGTLTSNLPCRERDG